MEYKYDCNVLDNCILYFQKMTQACLANTNFELPASEQDPNLEPPPLDSHMFSAVLKDPIRGLKEIYESVRNSYTEEMDRREELLFLSNFPAFRQIKPSLLRRLMTYDYDGP